MVVTEFDNDPTVGRCSCNGPLLYILCFVSKHARVFEGFICNGIVYKSFYTHDRQVNKKKQL